MFGYDTVEAKPIVPKDFSWKDAVEMADILCRAFEQEPLFWYWYGPTYQFGNDHEYIRLNIKDPRQRLVEFRKRAAAYTRLVETWARSLHQRILSRGYIHHGLYRDGDLIGFSSWRVPRHMKPQVEQEQGRTGQLFKLYRLWISVKYWIQDKWQFLGHPHPLANPRFDEYYDYVEADPDFPKIEPKPTQETYKKLSSLTRSQLAKEYYPEVDTVYLSFYLVAPEQQRQGFGVKFLNWSMGEIPTVDNPFTYRGQTAWGPQKFLLKSSDEGQKTYKYCGFEMTHYYSCPLDGRETVNVCMVKSMP